MPPSTRLILAILLLACLTAGGCVRRRMTVRSNLPGAMVYIDNQQIGPTPVSTGFTYYGTRNITLVKDGYETFNVKHNFDRPWYQTPGIDFFSENLTPGEIRDERLLDFTLVPQRMVPTEEIWANAEHLRRSAQQGYVVPLRETPQAIPQPGGTLENLPAPPALNPPGAPMMGDAGHRGPWR